MRQSLQCFKCGSRKFWVVDKVLQSLDHHGIDVVPMTVTKLQDHTKPDNTVGKFQVFICANPDCGYTEWHAYDLEKLKRLVLDPEARVHFYDGEPGTSGPYR
jgi:predicted nucleic-acid-binding Zn-ribbon protein